MKKWNYQHISTAVFLLLFAPGAFAQAADAAASTTDPYFFGRLGTSILVGFAAVVVIAAILVLYRLLSIMIKVQQIRIYQEQGLEQYLQEVKNPKSWWQSLVERWEDRVPMEREGEIMFEHSFDGIRELDNNLPPWWVALFYVTIFWAAAYMTYYHFTDMGPSSKEQYESEVAAAEEAIAAFRATQADLVTETSVVALTDETSLAAGKNTFTSYCAACHGQNGEGGVGPNFTDDFWLHGCDVKDLFKTIKYGVPEKGMISWQSQLRPAEMQKVASYILTMRGTNPANPKEPQGTECKPGGEQQATDMAAPASDSTAVEVTQ